MNYTKIKIVFALLIAVVVLWGVNIFLTNNVFAVLIDKPTKLSFMIMEPPAEECGSCFDANKILDMIDKAHNVKYKSNSIVYGSELSQKYIETYNIQNLPAIVVSGDIENENVLAAWQALSGEKRNEKIVIENLLPYYDIENDEVKGVVSVILIKDGTCESCFDENEYINILRRLGIVVGDTDVYDVASTEGKALVKKYSITKVPTMILSSDAIDYPGLVSSWGEVGTIEEDGLFILHEVQKVNAAYKRI